MNSEKPHPPLKPLHPETSLIPTKLQAMEKYSTEELVASLVPGTKECLKTRPDGTILDGHHRIWVLRQRKIDVDQLPRQIIEKEKEEHQ